MSSYQIKNGVGHRNFVELRHRRNNEQKRIFNEKKAMKKMIARAAEGGSNPLDAGRRMLGAVRVWSMTLDDEYFSHPAPPNAIVILDGQEGEGDQEEHCCKRWEKFARTFLGEQLEPAPAKLEDDDDDDEAQIPGSAAAAALEPEPEPEPEFGQDASADQTEGHDEEHGDEEEEEEEWEEDQEPYAVFVIDYTAVADQLPAETSQNGLGPAAKPIARALLKIAGDGMRLVACGPAALLACKVMQQPQVAERVAQLVLVRPEMPGGSNRSWLKPATKRDSTPALVFGGGEGGLVYEAQREGWVTGANLRPHLNGVFKSISYMTPTSETAHADRREIATVALHPLGDSYAALEEEDEGGLICAMEMGMESHYKKDLKGHYIGMGVAGQFRNTGEHDLSKEEVLRWLRTNLSPQFLEANGVVAPRENQSVAAAAKATKLDDLLAVYDKSIYEMDALISTRASATVATERHDDKLALKQEFESFGLGSSAVSGNYAQMEDFSDVGNSDAGGYGSSDGGSDGRAAALAGVEEGAEELEDLSDAEDDEASEAAGARADRLARFAAAPEPEPELSPEEAVAQKAALAAAEMEMELTYRYPSEEKRAAIRQKLAQMTDFERSAAVARLRSKREEEKADLLAQRAALGGFFAAHDVRGSSKHREKMMGIAMAATRPLKADKWSMICARLGETYGESPNQYFT